MEESQFFLSPIGAMLFAVIVVVIAVVLRTSAVSTRQQRRVYATLLEAAKKAAHQSVTVIVPLRRRADSLEGLFAMLERQAYDQLDVLVVVYHTAGSRASAQLRSLGRRYHLRVKTVRHTKGRRLEDIATRRTKSDIITLISASDQLTPRFFEQASYAFTQDLAALRVRTFVQLDQRLGTAFRALQTLFSEILTHGWYRPTKQTGLIEGVLVRRHTLAAAHPYSVKTMLFDNFALSRPAEEKTPTLRALIALMAVILITVVLVAFTPIDLLMYVSALAGGVLLITAALFIVQHIGYRFTQKAALLLLLPFVPLYVIGALMVSSAQFTSTTIGQKIRSIQRQQQATRRQSVRTQS